MADTVENRVRTIVIRVTKVRPSEVLAESNLVDDLGADNLDLMMISFDVERIFDFSYGSIDDSIRETWETVADIVATVEHFTRRAAA